MHMNKKTSQTLLCLSLLIATNICQISEAKRLVILHTNDTHSQIEPKDSLGGVLRRKAYIDEVRRENGKDNVLLLDAGDFCQGTPYFNFYKGDIEVEMMNLMEYDAVTLGNHEFDNGVDALANLLKKAKFKVVSSNYDLSTSPLSEKIDPWLMLEKGDVKVGIIGLNVNPEDLIAKENYEGVFYRDPIAIANQLAADLKNKGADVVIVLSHLGYEYENTNKASDLKLAKAARNIDIIIGGHSHTLLKEPVKVKAADGREILIGQLGKSGFYLGRIDLDLKKAN